MSREQSQAVFFTTAACLACLLLSIVDPSTHHLIPCVFHSLTGLQCAGCGMTRATHELLHGEWEQAWSLNPLVFGFLPLAGYTLIQRILSAWQLATLPKISSMKVVSMLMFLLVAVFMFWRNV